MCGIIGAVAERNVTPILLEGLRRLEYRGYDSAGIVLQTPTGRLRRERAVGKVRELARRFGDEMPEAALGLAHTRWATHGAPSELNAHPHISRDRIAVVHNGIIENHASLRRALREHGYRFESETDTEVIAHAIDRCYGETGDLLAAVQTAVKSLEGAFALAVMAGGEKDRLVVVRKGSPLVVGVGFGEHFIASDAAALLPVTQRFLYLEEGDIADIRRESVRVLDAQGVLVAREVCSSELSAEAVDKGRYRHFMLKEIHEQPQAIADTLEGRISGQRVLEHAFGPQAPALFERVRGVHLVACGTSYHAAMVARYWIEARAGLPCAVEVASEYRYRRPVVPQDTLFVSLSQSGETADTLAAVRMAKGLPYAGSLAICNVPESSLVRESDLTLMTRAGPEIGVASTKAFTTQLVALALLTVVLARPRGLSAEDEARLVDALKTLPSTLEAVLALDRPIAALAERFVHKQHALFLGRGEQYPIALEGALKLKEISYIHAEAYAAGELKHGPLALVDEEMPVIAVAANDDLLGKLLSNLQEVRARGGQLIVFAGPEVSIDGADGLELVSLPADSSLLGPVVHVLPLQLLAYHVAVLKGTDVDQPRNLAKSVTVE